MSAVRVQIGGFCIKGGGHSWTYGEGDGADGCSGWEMFIEVEPEDIHLFPEWVQTQYRIEEMGREFGSVPPANQQGGTSMTATTVPVPEPPNG